VIMYILLSGAPPFDENCVRHRAGTSIFDQIRRGFRSHEHFVGEPWESISDAAKQLVCQLLVVDPQQRLTVAGAQRHAWFRGETVLPPRDESMIKDSALLPRYDEISDCSDADDLDDRCTASRPMGRAIRSQSSASLKANNKRARGSAYVAPLQAQAAPSRLPLVPPPPSQPQLFKQPHQPGLARQMATTKNAQRGGCGAGGRFGVLRFGS